MSLDYKIILEKIINKQNLDKHELEQIFTKIISGEFSPIETAGLLVALRSKGVESQDLISAAQVILSHAHQNYRPNFDVADIVGTGGDGANTINISTISSLVAACAGIKVAKHGNISVSSQCGSADILREMGINLNICHEQNLACLKKYNWCFLFAQNYHPAFKNIKSIRSELKIRTIFNLLGPLTNPYRPKFMVVGVYDKNLVDIFAQAFLELEPENILVVHGSGLDEIALHGPSYISLVENKKITKHIITPSDLGLKEYSLKDIRGGTPQENLQDAKNILLGQGSDAKTSMIAASAGSLLYISKKVGSFKQGVEKSLESIYSKQVYNFVQEVGEFTHGA